MVFELPYETIGSEGKLQLLQGAQNASNTPEYPNLVIPVTSSISTGRSINYTAQGFSVSVLTVNTK